MTELQQEKNVICPFCGKTMEKIGAAKKVIKTKRLFYVCKNKECPNAWRSVEYSLDKEWYFESRLSIIVSVVGMGIEERDENIGKCSYGVEHFMRVWELIKAIKSIYPDCKVKDLPKGARDLFDKIITAQTRMINNMSNAQTYLNELKKEIKANKYLCAKNIEMFLNILDGKKCKCGCECGSNKCKCSDNKCVKEQKDDLTFDENPFIYKLRDLIKELKKIGKKCSADAISFAESTMQKIRHNDNGTPAYITNLKKAIKNQKGFNKNEIKSLFDILRK